MLSLFLLLSTAQAELPLPPHPDCAPDNLSACPGDLRAWNLMSNVPAGSVDTVRPVELAAGAGLGLDRAIRHTAGRFDVPVAILDSGIQWTDRRLYGKILLNTDELPLPQDATGAEVTDLDGNGVFNLFDYAEDARVDITGGLNRSDDRLDPSDLIAAFSDGVDDDGNGYVDDIAGWDFFGGDNDAWAELQSSSYASHGTGVMNGAVQPGGDGSGIGTCPNCSLIPIRVGDTFITDGDRVALGVAYATARGAKVIGMAVGAMTHPAGARDAVKAAADHDVVLVGAAGDENSWHHNAPSVEDPILYVHSVRADGLQEDGGAVSYTNFINCNNFGPRLDLVAPSTDCATGAVSLLSGVAGLIHSAGIDAGTPLSGDEVRALMRSTAFDVSLTEEERVALDTYPSKPGWDAFYGFGRADVGAAVEAVFAGELPPTAEITSPAWFAWVDGAVTVEGRISARAGVSSWTLELGEGPEPDSWQSVGSGTGSLDGFIAEVSLAGLGEGPLEDLDDDDTVLDRFYRAHEALATLRLTVTDSAGRVSEGRRAVWPKNDPDRLTGFPVFLGASVEAGPVLADLDGDSVLEIVAVSSDGRLHVLDRNGEQRDGFPVSTMPHPGIASGWSGLSLYQDGLGAPNEGVAASPAVGDIDGDGVAEIVVVGLSGTIYAWTSAGEPVPGFPTTILGRDPSELNEASSWDGGISGAPALGDVDGDGDFEVVVAAMDQRLYVLGDDGELFDGYPLELCHPDLCGVEGYRILSSPALGDVDGDGDLDAVLGTNEVPSGSAGLAYAVDLRSATLRPGWPQPREGLIDQTVLPVFGEGHPSSVALADVTGDGRLAMGSNAMLGSSDLLDADGEVVRELLWLSSGFGENTNYADASLLAMATQPAFGDLTGDGVPDFATGASGPLYLVSLALTSELDYQHAVGAWDGATGEMLPGFPRQVDDVSFMVAPTIADVTGDGAAEVIYGTGGYLLYAWDAQGTIAPGFPKHTGGWMLGGAAIGDVDGDGYHDVIAATRTGYLHAWGTAGPADVPPGWASTFHDAQNTGNAMVSLPVQAGPELADGCCRKNRADSAWMLTLALVFWRRRRDS